MCGLLGYGALGFILLALVALVGGPGAWLIAFVLASVWAIILGVWLILVSLRFMAGG